MGTVDGAVEAEPSLSLCGTGAGRGEAEVAEMCVPLWGSIRVWLWRLSPLACGSRKGWGREVGSKCSDEARSVELASISPVRHRVPT